jgi:hypothetical protein
VKRLAAHRLASVGVLLALLHEAHLSTAVKWLAGRAHRLAVAGLGGSRIARETRNQHHIIMAPFLLLHSTNKRHRLHNFDPYRKERRVPSSGVHKMNEQAQACLRKVAEWERSGQRKSDESARLLYLDLANHWRLAEHVEAMDRQRARFEQSEPKAEGA